jgi:hypothetical protein
MNQPFKLLELINRLVTSSNFMGRPILQVLKSEETKTKSYHFLPVNLPKHPLRHDLIQPLAKGIYVAQYQMYAGICTTKQMITNTLLSRTNAENKVPNKAPTKMQLVIRLSLSTMFFICLWNPIKNPVLQINLKCTQQGQARFQTSKLQRT